ncbi:MAG: hypothetical protein JJU15_00940 [Pararhodobacter sp.]|nr:hypothetical protein [Pararhodobacter sp.]
MSYRTLLRFARPVQVRLDLAEPGREPRHVEGRLAGFGRDGMVHFVEMAADNGQPAQRLRLEDVSRAIRRRGQEVDLRWVILNRAERDAFRTGRRVQLPSGWHPRAKLRNLWVAALVLAILWVPGFFLLQITGREEAFIIVMFGGASAWAVGSMLLLIPSVARRWADLRLLLGLWR